MWIPDHFFIFFTVADKIMHSRHFETDPTDSRIWINPKICFRIPDHLWFKFWRWRRFALCECFCCSVCLLVLLQENVVNLSEYVENDAEIMLLNLGPNWPEIQVNGECKNSFVARNFARLATDKVG